MSNRYRTSGQIPKKVIVGRLYDLSDAVSERNMSEFTMSIPVQLDRDADVVISEAAKRLGAGEPSLVDVLLPYAIGDAEDGGEDYAEYAGRLRDAVGVGQIHEALNDVADRMCEIRDNPVKESK